MTHKVWTNEELSDEEYEELLQEERDYWDRQDHPELERGERTEDLYYMYKREY